MTQLPSEFSARRLEVEDRLKRLHREAEVARLLRSGSRHAWQLRLWGWTVRLERAERRTALG